LRSIPYIGFAFPAVIGAWRSKVLESGFPDQLHCAITPGNEVNQEPAVSQIAASNESVEWLLSCQFQIWWRQTMRLGLTVGMVLAAVVLSLLGLDRGMASHPRVDRIEPEAAKAGALVTAFGVNLDRSRVHELILANVDRVALTSLTHMVDQSDVFIQFRVPRTLAPGQFRVELVVVNRWGAEVVEQPISFTVLQE
jgi:hypothetical protein